jgi:MFS family permease
VGALVSSFGVGAVLAMLAVPVTRDRLGHRVTSIAGLCVLAAGMIGVGLAPSPPWALGAMVIGGFGFLLAVTALTSLMHLRIDEEMRGRMMALWGIAFLGSRPVAAFLDGLVADASSPRVAAGVAAAVVLACSLVVARFVPDQAERRIPAT